MSSKKVKYPIMRSIRFSKKTDRYLVQAANVKKVKPAVLARQIIEEAVTPVLKEESNNG